MDAVEFIKIRARMCKNSSCSKCSLKKFCESDFYTQAKMIEDTVKTVEQWSKEHPVKTRQSELLKLFPDAEIRDGVLNVCPRKIDPEAYTHQRGYNCIHIKDDVLCPDCMRDFWLQEVD